MPITIVSKALYPVVPQAAGVPALLRNSASIIDALTFGYLGVRDALNTLIGAEPIRYAVFDSRGKRIADYDSVVAIGYQADSRVSDYPMEQGAFASYNKVQVPFDITVTLTCGGNDERRADFETAVTAARKSLELYTVLTPNATYKDVNFTSLSIRRTATEGANFIVADLVGREIRFNTVAAYSQPKVPAAFVTQAQGQIQIVNDVNFNPQLVSE